MTRQLTNTPQHVAEVLADRVDMLRGRIDRAELDHAALPVTR